VAEGHAGETALDDVELLLGGDGGSSLGNLLSNSPGDGVLVLKDNKTNNMDIEFSYASD
jgi:hypothetical protein